MTNAALYFGVHAKSISNIFNTGKPYNDFTYKFEVKDDRVWVYDCEHKLVKILPNILRASEWSKIPYTRINRYIKSGKLYKNKYYFYHIKSKFNPYFS